MFIVLVSGHVGNDLLAVVVTIVGIFMDVPLLTSLNLIIRNLFANFACCTFLL